MVSEILKICCVLAAAAALTSGGCARQVAERSTVARSGTVELAQGGAWESVFGPLHDYDPSALPEFGRNDYRLNASQPSALLATSQWPQPERDSLDNVRYLYLRDRDGRITYFGPDYYGRRDWHGHHRYPR
ncbi:MAG: hypothetical protein SH850_17265 [Planctomycetaceae bacterium]|nr:hypothetical protein [Planctomycetaceae bacterium]